MSSLGFLSGGLIALGTVLLIPEIPFGQRRPATPALTEEIGE
jgi:hypothetical protein